MSGDCVYVFFSGTVFQRDWGGLFSLGEEGGDAVCVCRRSPEEEGEMGINSPGSGVCWRDVDGRYVYSRRDCFNSAGSVWLVLLEM